MVKRLHWDCFSCKDWKGCPGAEWYKPFEIEAQFCFNHQFWIIQHLEMLRDGVYPPDPTPTGYSGGGSSTRFLPTAKFRKPADIYIEYTRRLERTEDAGEVLLHEVQTLGAMSVQQLSKPARDALYYCAGEEAKATDFSVWKAKRKYRGSSRIGYKNIP